MNGYWVAFTVKPLREKLACIWLSSIGIENAVPMAVRMIRRSRHQKSKPKPVKVPAMRGYVFARVPAGVDFTDFEQRVRICPSVRHPVGINGKPLRLLPNWEQTLRPEILDPECIEPPPVAIGDAVMITEEWEAFQGFTGRVDSIRGHEVTLLLDGLKTALLKLPINGVKKMAA